MIAPTALVRAGVARRALGYSASLAASRVVSAALTVVSTGILIEVLGPAVFGVFAVITGLYSLLSVVEYGSALGVNTMLAETEQSGDREASRAVVSTAFVLLRRWSWGLAALAALSAVVVPWQTLTGAGEALPAVTVHLAAGIYLVTFALALPLAVFPRTLDGLGQSAWNTLFLLSAPALLLVGVVILRPSTSVVAYCWLSSLGIVSFGALAMARVRRVDGGRLWPRRSAVKPEVMQAIWRRSWPMTVTAAAGTVAFALDPVVVASALGSESAAEYVLGAKVATLLTVAVTAPTPVLWNHFARRRARDGSALPRATLWRLQAVWAGLGLVLAAVLVVVGPPFTAWWSRGALVPPTGLFVALAVNLVVTAVQFPVATAMTDDRSVRFHAAAMAVMATLNLALSLVLVRSMGVAGPAVASALTLGVVVALPVTIRAYRVLP